MVGGVCCKSSINAQREREREEQLFQEIKMLDEIIVIIVIMIIINNREEEHSVVMLGG